MTAPTDSRGRSEAAIWQDVEFGNYAADLDLWIELANRMGDPILELGAGAGRVTLELAARGHRLLALENDETLVAELERSAHQRGLDVAIVRHDLASPADLRPPAKARLSIGPLHVIQMLDGGDRPALLRRLGQVLAPGATIALTVVDESTLLSAGASVSQILPDMRELDGWVYSSEPLWVQVGDEALRVRRLRERVSPEGRMERSVHDDVLYRVTAERLEQEAESVGLLRAGRRRITYGPNDADSTVVLLEVPS